MSTAGPSPRHGSAALVGNALVMLSLAACAWLFAGLHEGDWWQASPSRARVCIAAAALLGSIALVGCKKKEEAVVTPPVATTPAPAPARRA